MSERPQRILLVDDSPEDRETYRRFLTKQLNFSCEFAETESAEEALQLCRTFQPDCVLLDYKLPGVDGLYWLHRCRIGQAIPEYAVIMLTGQGDEQIAVEALKAGAQDYLVKSRITEESLPRAVLQAIDNINDQRRQAARQAELEKQATTDTLTGLLNRRSFLERLEKELGMVHRYQTFFSVLMIDVDHFKRINDTFGHLVGDHVLAQLGKILRSSLRSSDQAGRYGGEEFVVMALNTDLEGARIFSERIRQLFAQEKFHQPGHNPFSVTCSIGVAEAGPETTGIRDLITQADEALYQAKRKGRNQVCVAGRDSIEVH